MSINCSQSNQDNIDKKLTNSLSPNDNEQQFISKKIGLPERDAFKIFIKDEVLISINEHSINSHNYCGFLLGKLNLNGDNKFIEILDNIPIEDNLYFHNYSYHNYNRQKQHQFKNLNLLNCFLSIWTKLEEKISNLVIIGWYYINPFDYDKAKLELEEIDFHQLHFTEYWQIAMIINNKGKALTLLGRRGMSDLELVEFNGYFLFKEKEEELNIQLNSPVSIKSEDSVLPKLKISIIKKLDKKNLNILFNSEMLDQAYRHTRPHWFHESGGILLGRFYGSENILYISQQIPALNTESGAGHLTFTHETWSAINKKRANYPELIIVGWYHSHPGFGVFLSKHDEFIHKEYFNSSYQVALVIDSFWKKYCFFGWYKNQLIKLKSYKI